MHCFSFIANNLIVLLCSDVYLLMLFFRYIVNDHERSISLTCVSENDKRKFMDDNDVNIPNKKQKLSKRELKKLTGIIFTQL